MEHITTTSEAAQRVLYLMGDVIDSEWTPDQRAAWSGFLELSACLKLDHNHELETEHGLSISMVGLLGRLAAAENHVQRLTDLAAAMGLSLSRVSRIIDILERRHLVERVQCPNDGRAVNAQLTSLGLSEARQAQTTLRAAVQRDFLEALRGSDAALLAASFQRLLAAMEARRDRADTTEHQVESVE